MEKEKSKKRRRKKPFSPNINIWLDVKADIEIKIINGEYTAGNRLPPIVKVAEIYEVGNTTAQKVLDSLFEDGIVVKQKGVGYFVKPYMKDKLIKKHEKELSNRFLEAIMYGKKLGLDGKRILEIVEETLVD